MSQTSTLTTNAVAMLQSPVKRRKISETESIAVNNEQRNGYSQSTPTTPSRASYSSPTKASLARSNPHLLDRGRLLRQSVLSGKRLFDAQKATGQYTQQPVSQSIDGATARQQTRAEIQRSPQRADLLDSRQKSPPETSSGLIVPRLVTTERRDDARSRSRSNEPALPPTPVQLGLNPPPERPRGLSSSSPRSSRSGSGRRRQRLLDGQTVTSSPLKPKHQQPNILIEETLPLQPDEAPESEADDHNDGEAEEMREKREEIKRLKAQIAALKKSNLGLERATKANDVQHEIKQDPKFLELLYTSGSGVASKTTNLDSDMTSTTEQSFLNLFAPGNLQVTCETSSRIVRRLPMVVHKLKLTAPPPWPEHIFSATFEVETDGKAKKVEKVVFQSDRQKSSSYSHGIPHGACEWVQQRLQSDLHKRDVTGLIWGLGMYFQASVRRARVFRSLAQQHSDSIRQVVGSAADAENSQPSNSNAPLTESEAHSLLQYLNRDHLEFHLPPSPSTNTASPSIPKILAVWDITLTWTGEARSTYKILPSSIPDSASQPLTELFERLCKADGFERACHACLALVKGDDDGDGPSGISGAAGKGKGGKRKRFT